MKNHEIWVDNVKVTACILVVLGHFFQSMVKADILPDNHLYQWFNQTIYLFHVPLFFLCSGYLYQKYSNVNSIRRWSSNLVKKLFNLGIPYFTFTIITLVLKKLFEGAVNTSENSFVKSLFINPIAPYWYFYVLFFIFLITPTFISAKKMLVFFVIALGMKLLYIFVDMNDSVPYAIRGILDYEIWFAVGMLISRFRLTSRMNMKISLLGVLFLALSVLVYAYDFSFQGMNLILSLLACASVISAIYCRFKDNRQNKLFGMLSRYTLPIFVMHTIFAAGFRGVLLKLGITSAILHISVGLTVSFLCPILAAIIMEKIKYLDVFLYPSKYIKVSKVILHRQMTQS